MGVLVTPLCGFASYGAPIQNRMQLIREAASGGFHTHRFVWRARHTSPIIDRVVYETEAPWAPTEDVCKFRKFRSALATPALHG